ncbi:MAG TPA: inner-membrane translocator [Ktedonobacterales bacterium]|nr:inner-membrane translocator [Ktedonobacterales bacterium]
MSEQLSGSREEASAAVAPGKTAAVAPAQVGAATAPTPAARLREYLRGDLGPFPVIVALVVMAVLFQFTTSGIFLTPRNISESVIGGEAIVTAVFALGAVLVLLLGEIDLSLAVVGTLCAYVMAIMTERVHWPFGGPHDHWPALAAILVGLLVGVVVGLVNGFFVAVMRMPSFVVTLAGLIGYQGLIIRLGNKQQTIPISNNTINSIFPTTLCPGFDSTSSCADPLYLGIVLPLIGLALYLGYGLLNRRARAKAELDVEPFGQFATRLVIVTAAVAIVVGIYSAYRGFPLPAMILVALIIILWLITRATAFGRHIYAVGGNAEAARRAGINVVGLRVAIFAMASTLAAIGGILEASQETSAPSLPSPALLLNAIATAVIGGVSLFGGRGSMWAVVLGTLVLSALLSGLLLMGQGDDVLLMAEGIILLAAVLVDALARRRSVTGYR